MSALEQRNAHFDRLFATKNLFWLGQNTNHLPMHPRVREALCDSIAAEEFHAYAPPGGFTALLNGIVEDLGLPHESTAALITDGAVAALSRFVKVSTTVPAEWVDAFCRELPDAIVAARGLNDVPELF